MIVLKIYPKLLKPLSSASISIGSFMIHMSVVDFHGHLLLLLLVLLR